MSDGLDNDCDEEIDPDNTCDDECAGFALDGRGYMFCIDTVSRQNAEQGCEGVGMHLIWLETPDESDRVRDFIVTLIGLQVPIGNAEILTQIGGSDAASEGQCTWVGSGDIADSFQFWQAERVDKPRGAPMSNGRRESPPLRRRTKTARRCPCAVGPCARLANGTTAAATSSCPTCVKRSEPRFVPMHERRRLV